MPTQPKRTHIRLQVHTLQTNMISNIANNYNLFGYILNADGVQILINKL